MAALFGVGLIAFEIVDAGGDEVAGFLPGANGVNGVPDHEQGLEGNHHFVIFNVITNNHENRFFRHGTST